MLRTVVAAVSLWLALPLGGCIRIPTGGTDRLGKIQEAAKVASATLGVTLLAKKLAKIEAEFQERRQKLSVVSAGTESEAYRAKEVESLVNSTEDHVLDALEGKELAALRDSIRLRFRRIHQGLQASAQTGRLHEPSSGLHTGFRLAAFGPDQNGLRGLLLRTRAESLLDAAGSVLRRVTGIAEDKHFALRLCVISRPEPGATFRMWPPENQDGPLVGDTARDIQEAPLGLYFYQVKYAKRSLGKKLGSIECKDPYGSCPVDLFDSEGDQLVVCDFMEKRCKIRELSSSACPPQ